ncbi:MAG TPA: plasmid mobilization relaxosome protein MobC [Puia sp.]|nr:plasmid mobilization relaxosome protein MobC [Puia sp.]
MKRKELRSRNLIVRLTPEEYADLQEKFHATTHRVFSDYIRDLIHERPVTTRYRNQSLDEFIPVALALKNELQTIGRNFNQAVRRLNNLTQAGELKDSLEYFAAEEFTVQEKVEEIKNCLIKIYDLWSRK